MACASGLSLMAWGLGCWAKEAWGFFGCQGVGLGVWGFGLCRALGLEFGGKACEFGCNWGAKPHQKTLYLIPVIAWEDPEMEFGRLASRQCASRRSPRSLLAAMLRALLPRRFRT